MIYPVKTPYFFKLLYPGLVWEKNTNEKEIYLTFDDGPIKDITPWVLKQLKEFNAEATFFCIGDNIRKNSDVYKELIRSGHRLGNHTYHHLSGWKVQNSEYYDNIEKCDSIMNLKSQHKLFRPPYGKIKWSQIPSIKKHYDIIMWDVLSGDFDNSLIPENCLKQTIKATKPGSIVIFHDSIKAERNLKYVLPKYLNHFCSLGYKFRSL